MISGNVPESETRSASTPGILTLDAAGVAAAFGEMDVGVGGFATAE